MRYYIDTEFIEDFHKPLFGKRRHYIDLISIAIVAEDGREYYAVSNEFDLKHAWNKYDIKEDFGKPQGLGDNKVYWLRDNVLKNIWSQNGNVDLSYKAVELVINTCGKSNKQIAQEITSFVNPEIGVEGILGWINKHNPIADGSKAHGNAQPEFYGYYADYDWVLFCSLYGCMLDLPKGFPMYCRDLKQMVDEKEYYANKLYPKIDFKNHVNYPKQSNSHHALDDARWNKKLHEFLSTI